VITFSASEDVYFVLYKCAHCYYYYYYLSEILQTFVDVLQCHGPSDI